MIVVSAVAQFLGVNCWALAPDEGSECVLFDAGLSAVSELSRILAEEELRPAALVLTHGHPDHILGLPDFYERFGPIPVYIHAADEYRVADPVGTMNPEFREILAPLVTNWHPPALSTLTDGAIIEHAGLTIRLIHTPGHTEGSSLFMVSDQLADRSAQVDARDRGPADTRASGSADALMMSGDVLFAGSIGRTDLPGSDPAAMQNSLALLKTLPDVRVYPGHGPATRLGHELRVNPFL